MKEMNVSEIAERLGTKLSGSAVISEVVTDSRQAAPGKLFVAIVGENADGNDYAAKALENGAEAVVVSRASGLPADRTILVPDTKRALIAIGGLYREKFSIPFVGVTGSVGKTTTKEFIYAVLSSRYRTHRNEGNQNNEIGVPNTLFALEDSHELAVIEMGMSGLGEISDLTHAVKPAVGVITTIGVSHIEMLGSRENILRAKTEIIEGMPAGAPLFVCGDNDLLSGYENADVTIYRFGITNQKCELLAHDIHTGDGETRFVITSPWGEANATIPTVGQHHVLDALAAFGVGCVLGLSAAEAAAALSRYLPTGMRQKIVSHNGYTVVEDCYNASPDSLKAAVLTLSSYPCKGKRILVVSDMLELGEESSRLHAECGSFIARQGIDLLIGWGEETRHLIDAADAAGMERVAHYADKAAFTAAVCRSVSTGDVLWLKASRGRKLEEVLDALYGGGSTK